MNSKVPWNLIIAPEDEIGKIDLLLNDLRYNKISENSQDIGYGLAQGARLL